jgi:hypothetical protein
MGYRELSPSEERQFETQYFSSPERRAQVEFARSLARARPEISATPSKGRSVAWKFGLQAFWKSHRSLQWASGAAALMLAAAGSWLIFQNYQLRIQLQEAQKQHQAFPTRPGGPQDKSHAPGPTLAASNPSESPNTAENSTVATLDASQEPSLTFTLSSGAVRGAQSDHKDLTIPSDVSSVVLRLPLNDSTYPTYQAELQTVEGHIVQISKELTSRRFDRQAAVLFRVAIGQA